MSAKTHTNALGHAHTGADAASMQLYEAALRCFQQMAGDPIAHLNKAIATSPAFTMAYVARALMCLVGTDPGPRQLVRNGMAAMKKLAANDAEKRHVEAVGLLANGEMRAAAHVLEDIGVDNPHDILAIQIGQLLDLMLGDTRMLRDRPARAFRYWSEDMPGYSSMLAMMSFGLEENGDYARAEKCGREAIRLDPKDGWAQHAVAHVYEMQGDTEKGLAWMLDDHERWSVDNFMAVHNWWHTALYHLELDNFVEVLRLHDGPIYGAKSELAYDMIDASALLWRLTLRRIDVGDRWQSLADNWEKIASDTEVPFNDAHALMAFSGAGRTKAIEKLRKSQENAFKAPGDYGARTGAIGRAVSEGIIAFGEEDYAAAVDHLRGARAKASAWGGSHAQRDVIDLTLIEAALRSGETSLARALTAERAEAKPDLRSTQMLVQRAATEATRRAAE